MQSNQYWVGFGDVHDDTTRLVQIPELREASGVIVSGDLTLGGSVKQAERVMNAVAGYNSHLFAQIGNMDRGEVTGYLEEQGWNIHARGIMLTEEIGLMGVGTSTFTPFGTPSEFPESRIAEWLEQAHRQVRGCRRLILVSHTPPVDTACDALPDGVHVGSSAVREFIEEVQPDVCLCGHIHEARAVDRLGRTVVVNPGTLSSGGYVVIRNGGNGLEVELKTL